MSSNVVALVPAAGDGMRFGGAGPKVLTEIAGRPLLAHTVDRLLAAGVEQVIVAAGPDWLESAEDMLGAREGVRWVAGGQSRQASVLAALRTVTDADVIVVHDGARPAVHPDDIRRAIEALRGVGGTNGPDGPDGAVLGRPVADTLKRVASGRVTGTVDRESLFRAETPQVFGRQILTRALEAAMGEGFVGTDESSVVERVPGARIVAVEARHPNPKLTAPADRMRIESLLGRVGWAG